MKKKKILVLLPDEGGLRNFVFTNFNEIGIKNGFDVYYWNNSNFPVNEKFGYNEIKINRSNSHKLTPIYSRARKRIELNLFKKKFKDSVYDMYKFPLNYNGFKNIFKSLMISFLVGMYGSNRGIKKLRKRIEKLERLNINYKVSVSFLKEFKPDVIICSNQRNTAAICSLLAARDLGITTVSFVQSWDNVPKAMQVIDTDYYFVWSELMKNEQIKYYPFVNENQVFITGTPQFEFHFWERLKESRLDFFQNHGLDVLKKYICFSGDDSTTSPLDPYYLEDLSNAVRNLNLKGYNLGIIFRKCPFEVSNRYDVILKNYEDVIKIIDPIWTRTEGSIMGVLPQIEDLGLLYNICEHSEFVTNVCSTTVFDFVAHKKPCIYFNYEQPQLKKGIRDIGQNYEYVHFRSMPSEKSVLMCKSKKDLEGIIENILNKSLSNVKDGTEWFKIIAGPTPTDSSKNMWNALSKIIE